MKKDEITLKIDGREVTARRGMTILEVADKAGIRIPTLCHHPMLEPTASCRVCVVEIERGRRARIVTACNFPIRDENIEINTRSERVLHARKMVVEFLLARCPEERVVKELAEELGIRDTPYPKESEQCLLCGRCVVVCNEVVGAKAIGFQGRGIFLNVGTPFGIDTDACIGCGACTYVCPTGAIQMEEEARKRFRRLPGSLGLCRYARMGLIPYKVCPNDFECFRCEVEQRMIDTFGIHPALAVRPAGERQAERIGEFVFRPDVLYHPGHVWARPLYREAGKAAKVMLGVDDVAQRLFFKVEDISLAPVGKQVKRGDVAWEIDCGNRKRAKMLFPFEGRIADVNPDVQNDPSLVNKDSYSRGWIYLMVPSQAGCLESFLSRYEVRKWFTSETKRLQNAVEGNQALVVTDSGYVLNDLPKTLSDEQWGNLVNKFFLF
jgi:glycine cleavage system H lipoate-binding protein/Pyruvate/2-oxoacid:ferredoxin oxidoreductase delta subunit